MSFHPRLPMLPAGRVVLTLSTVVAAAILLLAARLLPVEPGRWGATAPAYLQAQSGDGAPRPTTTVVSSEALPHVAGKRVTTVLVEFPPGGFSPEHHHAGSVSVYVLSGEIEITARRRARGDLHAGRDVLRAAGRRPRLRPQPQRHRARAPAGGLRP